MNRDREQLAADENTSPGKLKELARFSIELARIVAKNASADSEILQELSLSSDVIIRQNVASNPNTPQEILYKLAEEFPQEFLNNPLFPLLSLENPNWLADISDNAFKALIKQEGVPESILNSAVNRTDPSILMTLLMNPILSKTILNKLVDRINFEEDEDYISAQRDPNWQGGYCGYEKVKQTSWDIEISEAAKLHINWTEKIDNNIKTVIQKLILKTVLKSYEKETDLFLIGAIPAFVSPILDWDLKKYIAKNPNTHPSVLRELALSPKKYLLLCVAENPSLPLYLVEYLLGDDDVDIRKNINYHPKLPFTTLEKFRAAEKAVEDITTTEDLLSKLAESQWVIIRKGVAAHPNISIEILRKLATDRDFRVRATVASNPKLPIDLLEQLAADERQLVRESVATNPNVTSLILSKLAKDKSWKIRELVAKNIKTPVDILEEMLVTGSGVAVARNPSTPEQILKQIAFNEKTYIRSSVIYNHNVSQEILEYLANDRNPKIRGLIAGCSKTSESILEKLATDSDVYVRCIVARNPNLKRESLEKLAEDPSDKVREIAINFIKSKFCPFIVKERSQIVNALGGCYLKLAPDTPVNVLEELLQHSQDPYVEQYAISWLAIHPNVTISMLETLAKNNKYWVRKAVAQNSKSSDRILALLAEDSHEDVRHAVAQNQNTKINIIEKLASDSDYRVRRSIANNPNTPIHILKILLHDKDKEFQPDESVAKLAMLNITHNFACDRNLDPEIIIELANEQDWRLGIVLARHPNTPQQALEKLANHYAWSVRATVANNFNTPVKLLEQLIEDDNYLVAEEAINSISWDISNHPIVEQFAALKHNKIQGKLI